MTYPASIPLNLGMSRTGLTLQAQPFDVLTGDPIGSVQTDTFLEVGLGMYVWSGNLPDNQTVGVKFLDDTDALVASTVVGVEEIYDISAMKAKLDSLNVTTAITIAVAVDPQTGNLTIVRGDAYKATTPKGALVWTETTGAWMAYVGKPAVFTAKAYKDDGSVDTTVTPISKTATIVNTTGNHCTATVELDSADTKNITDKQLLLTWQADLQVTVASQEDETLISIALTILQDVSPAST